MPVLPHCIFLLMDCWADVFLKQLANHLFDTWDRSFLDVLHWIRLKLAFSLLHVMAVCLRGSRTKW